MISDARPEDRQQIALYVLEIETDHKPGPDGTLVAVDRITFGKRGAPNYQQIFEVNRLKKDDPVLWDHVKPIYEKWQKDNIIATEGHPLEAWPVITKGQIKVCKSLGLRSVEDVAQATDSVREKFGMGFLDLRNQAKAFLANKADSATANKVADLEAKMAQLIADNEEARRTIDALMAERGKRPVGRPRKDAAEAA
jgi:hypothetical protein